MRSGRSADNVGNLLLQNTSPFVLPLLQIRLDLMALLFPREARDYVDDPAYDQGRKYSLYDFSTHSFNSFSHANVS